MAIVIITILNDGCILSIAYDVVEPSNEPERWYLKELISVSATLGLVACCSTLGLLHMCLTHMGAQGDNFLNAFGVLQLDYGEVITAIYLKVSVSDFLTVFCARTKRHVFSRKPGMALFCAALIALTTSTCMSIFWFLPRENIHKKGLPMGPITPHLAGVIWVWNLIWWIVQEGFKLLV